MFVQFEKMVVLESNVDYHSSTLNSLLIVDFKCNIVDQLVHFAICKFCLRLILQSQFVYLGKDLLNRFLTDAFIPLCYQRREETDVLLCQSWLFLPAFLNLPLLNLPLPAADLVDRVVGVPAGGAAVVLGLAQGPVDLVAGAKVVSCPTR